MKLVALLRIWSSRLDKSRGTHQFSSRSESWEVLSWPMVAWCVVFGRLNFVVSRSIASAVGICARFRHCDVREQGSALKAHHTPLRQAAPSGSPSTFIDDTQHPSRLSTQQCNKVVDTQCLSLRTRRRDRRRTRWARMPWTGQTQHGWSSDGGPGEISGYAWRTVWRSARRCRCLGFSVYGLGFNV